MVQESIKYFPIPLRKSPKVIAEDDFLVTYVIVQLLKVTDECHCGHNTHRLLLFLKATVPF